MPLRWHLQVHSGHWQAHRPSVADLLAGGRHAEAAAVLQRGQRWQGHAVDAGEERAHTSGRWLAELADAGLGTAYGHACGGCRSAGSPTISWVQLISAAGAEAGTELLIGFGACPWTLNKGLFHTQLGAVDPVRRAQTCAEHCQPLPGRSVWQPLRIMSAMPPVRHRQAASGQAQQTLPRVHAGSGAELGTCSAGLFCGVYAGKGSVSSGHRAGLLSRWPPGCPTCNARYSILLCSIAQQLATA